MSMGLVAGYGDVGDALLPITALRSLLGGGNGEGLMVGGGPVEPPPIPWAI